MPRGLVSKDRPSCCKGPQADENVACAHLSQLLTSTHLCLYAAVMEIPQTKPFLHALAFVLMVIFASPRGPLHPCHVLLGLTFLARDRSTKAFVLSAHLGNSNISQAKQVASRAWLGATQQHPEASRAQVALLVATAQTLKPPLLRLHLRHVLRVPSTAIWASR